MIKQLKTKNFRRLTDHTFDFTAGLNAVRGANEQGKSTSIEAIAYCCFGIKACRSPLAELVIWGQPEKTLKVELQLELEGCTYTITRSKSGAEVNYAGGKVVGQSEVTSFVERLLGANAATAGKLMLAEQGQIRGALNEGPAAPMALIEKLADFNIIDTVIDLIQTNRVTGNTAAAEERVKQAEIVLESSKSALVPVSSITDQLAVLDGETAQHQVEIDTNWGPKHTLAVAAVAEANAQVRQREMLTGAVTSASARLKLHQEQLRDALQVAGTKINESRIAELRLHLTDAKAAAALVAKYWQFTKLEYPELFWTGDAASLAAEIASVEKVRESVTAQIRATEALLAKGEADVRVLEAQRIKGSTCGFCDQDISQFPSVLKKNAEIDAEQERLQRGLAANRGYLEAEQAKAKEAAAARLELLAVHAASVPFDRFREANPELVTVDPSFVPLKLTWVGRPPQAGADPATLARELTELERLKESVAQATARATALTATIEEDLGEIGRLNGDLAKLPEADKVQALQDALAQVNQHYEYFVNRVNEVKYKKQQLVGEHAAATAAYNVALAGVVALEKSLGQAQIDLQTLIFNNNLLKRVRLARPVIADRLWSVVLAAVSTFFSTMRGEKSVVTKEAGGFKVNGQSITGLSGSTLDCLGLSIRCALSRTFLPAAPFLILDEPAAAMDVNREGTVLGFLAAAGFPQTVLITHSDVAESVAENLIEIS